MKLKDVAVFSRQFATMINAGLSLLRALYILAEQTENKALAEITNQVRIDVEKGASLSQAMSKHPKAFNRLYIAMVKAGEIGGVLDSVLLRLADTIEKQVELRRKVKSAMTYPAVVAVLVLVIVERDAPVHHPDVPGPVHRARWNPAAADPDPHQHLEVRAPVLVADLRCRDRGGVLVPALDQLRRADGTSGTRSS